MSAVARFEPMRVLRMLTDRGVEFVVIGGIAARLHGSPTVTRDLDLCYGRSPENLEALVIVLRELGAGLRGVDDEVPFVLDAATLREGDHFTFSTAAGPLDVLGVPAGTAGFDALRRTAVTMDLGDVEVAVASIDDLIAMKRAAGRPKDLIELEVLGALRDEIDLRERQAGD